MMGNKKLIFWKDFEKEKFKKIEKLKFKISEAMKEKFIENIKLDEWPNL